jgi:hypothetical protein
MWSNIKADDDDDDDTQSNFACFLSRYIQASNGNGRQARDIKTFSITPIVVSDNRDFTKKTHKLFRLSFLENFFLTPKFVLCLQKITIKEKNNKGECSSSVCGYENVNKMKKFACCN